MATEVTQTGSMAAIKIQAPESGPDAPVTNAPAKGERPAWLPEKFKSAEDLAKSYTELEKKLGGPKQAEAPTVTPVVPSAPSSLEIKANEAVKAAGLDMTALQAEYTAKGELSAESLKKLSDSGIGADQISVYKRGMEANRQDYETKITEGLDGGRESFDEALKWAADNLSEDEQASFNKAVAMGDANIGKLAVQGLMVQFNRADGPHLVDGSRATSDSRNVFSSHAEIQEAMGDRRYKSDPAYRSQVEQKVIRSDYSKFSH